VNVILGQRAFEARAHMQQAEEQAGRAIEQPDQGRRCPRHKRERLGDAHRNRFRIVQSDVLGRQLPDNEGGVGHADCHDDDRKRLAIGCQERNEQESFFEPFGERDPAENSCERRGSCKTYLDRGQHTRWIGSESKSNWRSRSPLLHQALQMPAARGHDGKLCHGEQAV
jgi:hypothetical protein